MNALIIRSLLLAGCFLLFPAVSVTARTQESANVVSISEIETHLVNYLNQAVVVQGNVTVTEWQEKAAVNYQQPETATILHAAPVGLGRFDTTIYLFASDQTLAHIFQASTNRCAFYRLDGMVVQNAGPSGGNYLDAYLRINQVEQQKSCQPPPNL